MLVKGLEGWGRKFQARKKHGYRLKWSRGYKDTFGEHKVVPSAWIIQSAKGNMVRNDTGEVEQKPDHTKPRRSCEGVLIAPSHNKSL